MHAWGYSGRGLLGVVKTYPEWSFRFANWFGNLSTRHKQLLDICHCKQEIPQPQAPFDLEISEVLYMILSQICKERAHKLIRGSPQGNGLEAYRRLRFRYGQEDEFSSVNLFKQIMSFSFAGKQDELEEKLLEFDLLVQKHDQVCDTGDEVPEAVLKALY